MYQQGKGKSKLQKGCTPHTFSSFQKFKFFCLIFLFSKFKKWILSKILLQNDVYITYFRIREMWHKNWINEKRQRSFSMKHAFLQKLKTFAFEYAGFIFSVKTFSTMKKKTINHMPENHLLVIWLYYFSFVKYDLAKFGSVMKQKGLIFINFYVFGWWRLSLKVIEASSIILEKDEIQ